MDFLYFESELIKDIVATWTLSIESAGYSMHTKTFFSKEVRNRGTVICLTNELFDDTKNYIVDGRMTIRITGSFTVSHISRNLTVFTREKSIGKLLWERQDKDFTLVVQDQKIQVHKFILSASSPVFDKVFQNEWKEAKENQAYIEDFDPETVLLAIRHCYDVPIVISCRNQALCALQFADKYELNAFKDEMEEYLMKEINIACVCKIANYSMLFSAEKLKKKCIDYLLQCYKKCPVTDIALLDKDFVFELTCQAFQS